MPLVRFFASFSTRKCRPVQTKMQDHSLLNPGCNCHPWYDSNGSFSRRTKAKRILAVLQRIVSWTACTPAIPNLSTSCHICTDLLLVLGPYRPYWFYPGCRISEGFFWSSLSSALLLCLNKHLSASWRQALTWIVLQESLEFKWGLPSKEGHTLTSRKVKKVAALARTQTGGLEPAFWGLGHWCNNAVWWLNGQEELAGPPEAEVEPAVELSAPAIVTPPGRTSSRTISGLHFSLLCFLMKQQQQKCGSLGPVKSWMNFGHCTISWARSLFHLWDSYSVTSTGFIADWRSG